MDTIKIGSNNHRNTLERIIEKLDIGESEMVLKDKTDNLLKSIGTEEVPLKIDDAQLICTEINNILEEKNIDLIIDPEDLLNSRRYEAKEKVEEYIAELDKHKKQKDYIIDSDDLDDIEFLLNEYDLMDKKIKAYEIIGDIYFNSRNYEKEYEYMCKAWELTTRYPKRKLNYRIMIKLANNYIDRGKYQDAITLYQKALLNVDNIPEKYLIHLYYNYALAYCRLKLYSPSLEIISDLLRYTERKDYDLWSKSFLLEGLCYFEKGSYESALSSYNNALQVLTFTGYSDLKYLIYGNIAEVYLKLNDINRVNIYLDMILRDIDELNKNEECYWKVCYDVAKLYKSLGEFRKSEKYHKESLKYINRDIQQNYISKNIVSLIELNNEIKIDDIFEIIEQYSNDIISFIGFSNDSIIVFKCLKTYVDNKEYNRFEKLIDNIIKYKGGANV